RRHSRPRPVFRCSGRVPGRIIPSSWSISLWGGNLHRGRGRYCGGHPHGRPPEPTRRTIMASSTAHLAATWPLIFRRLHPRRELLALRALGPSEWERHVARCKKKQGECRPRSLPVEWTVHTLGVGRIERFAARERYRRLPGYGWSAD